MLLAHADAAHGDGAAARAGVGLDVHAGQAAQGVDQRDGARALQLAGVQHLHAQRHLAHWLATARGRDGHALELLDGLGLGLGGGFLGLGRGQGGEAGGQQQGQAAQGRRGRGLLVLTHGRFSNLGKWTDDRVIFPFWKVFSEQGNPLAILIA